MNKRFAATLSALALGVAASTAQADVIFEGSGTGEAGGAVSATAVFSFDSATNTLTLLLSADTTTEAQGDALTGILFDIGGVQTLSFDMVGPVCGTELGAGSAIWTSDTTSNTTDPLCGSWTDQRDATPPIAGEFGVATTGFGGNFNGGSITLGNASPDYGIVGPNSFPAPLPSDFGGSSFPFIQNSLLFTFTTTGSVSEGAIGNVTFLFGTAGDDTAPGVPVLPVPEPGSLALLGIALGVLGLRRRLRA